MTRRQREEEDGRKRSAEEQTDRNGMREGVEREERREARGERREERGVFFVAGRGDVLARP